MARVVKLAVPEVDDRALELRQVVLQCRSYGHRWVEEPIGRARILELALQGLKERITVCANGCGQRVELIFNRSTGEQLDRHHEGLTKDYLVPPGTGRLPRGEARKALWLAEDQDLYDLKPARKRRR